MAILRYDVNFRRLSAAETEAWRAIPTAIATDSMNRERAMAAAIKPVAPGIRLVGQARTISIMTADNGPVHAAIPLAGPGDVLVIAAGGHEDVAICGGIICTCAKGRGIAGMVVDGTVRDIAELRAMDFPVFARGAVPRGPHKGHGGFLDGPVSCGGVAVMPGDIVLGDDDGVVIVPLGVAEAVLAASRATMAKEADIMAALATGKTTFDLMGMEAPRTATV